MAKTHVNRLIGNLESRGEPPKPFGLCHLFMLASGREVPHGFPAGAIAPAGIPDGKGRKWIRDKLATDFAKWDHETLARAAAWIMEGSMLWRSVFAHYAKDKEIELRQTKSDLLQEQVKAAEEFLEVLADPGTRAYLNAQAKWARDPVKVAEVHACELWEQRYLGKCPRLRTVDQWAMECVRRWPVLKISTLKRWSTRWTREKKRAC